ncbi:hypothetical protein Tco_0872726, partial [Tanacetum coccineum]
MLRAFPIFLTGVASRWLRNEPSEVPTRQILDSKGAIPTMTAANARIAIQEMAEHSQKWHNGTSIRTKSTETSDGLTAIQAQLNNLGREIKKKSRGLDQNLRDSNRADEQDTSYGSKPIRHIRPSGQYADFRTNQMTIPFPSRLYHCDEEKGSYGLKDMDAYSIGTTLCNDALPQKGKRPRETVKHPKDMTEDVKVPLILGRQFLSTAHAKIDVFKRKITLRVGDEKNIFKSVKPASSLIKRVYMLSLRDRIELDLEARLMGETLILNRLLDPLYGDYIKLNYLNVPLELRRNQADDLEPTIEEGEVDDEPMEDIDKARCNDEIIGGLDEYPSYCDLDRKIHIDCAYNLKFSCMIG